MRWIVCAGRGAGASTPAANHPSEGVGSILRGAGGLGGMLAYRRSSARAQHATKPPLEGEGKVWKYRYRYSATRMPFP